MEFSLKKLKSIFIESDPEEVAPAPVEEEAPVVEEEAVVEELTDVDIDWQEEPILEEESIVAEPIAEEPIVPAKEPVLVQISQFRACSDVASQVLEGYPVFANFSAMDYADAKRTLDFLGGVIYAVKGTLQQVTDTVFYLAANQEKQDDTALREIYDSLCAE